MRLPTTSHHAGYLSLAFDPAKSVRKARDMLKGIKFDVFVGTGMSGALVVPVLAYALRKRYAIVRKSNDNGKANHSEYSVEGTFRPGDRWLFVDDFVSTGRTVRRVHSAMRAKCSVKLSYVGMYLYMDSPPSLTMGDKEPSVGSRS